MRTLAVTVLITLFSPLIFASETNPAPLKEIDLVTMEIPPFMSEHMPDQGAGSYALKMLLKKHGYNVTFSFAPFLRSKALATGGDEFIGYAPSTKYNLIRGFALSKYFFDSPWVIIQNKENRIQWKKISDLTKYRGGNVNGYDMVPEATKLYNAGKLNIEMAPDDTKNILKLAHKRIDYIFMDENMFKFLIATSPALKPFANKLEIHPRHVEMLSYGIAFRQTPRGEALRRDIDKVINSEEFSAYVAEYMKNLESAAATTPKAVTK